MNELVSCVLAVIYYRGDEITSVITLRSTNSYLPKSKRIENANASSNESLCPPFWEGAGLQIHYIS